MGHDEVGTLPPQAAGERAHGARVGLEARRAHEVRLELDRHAEM
jgi:hypothetical protein